MTDKERVELSEIEKLQREVTKLTTQRNTLAFNCGRERAQFDIQLKQCRADAALVINALNCAIQLTDALIAFLPEGTPMHPGVATAKAALDAAMLQISRQTQLTEDVDRLREENERLKANQITTEYRTLAQAAALQAQAADLAVKQRDQVTLALNQAILLIDQLLTEMRLANVTPSAGVIFTKANFDQKMRVLLNQGG